MKTLILNLFLLLAGLCSAQDATFDMSYANRLLLNPAFCGGNGEGVVRTSLFHHNVFNAMNGTYNNSSASIDYLFCEPKIAVGLIAQNENQGAGLLTINSISPVIGIPIEINPNLLLSFGLQADFMNQSVDWSKMVFSDQISPTLGVVQSSSNANATLLNRSAYGVSSGINLTGKNRIPIFVKKHIYEGNNMYKWNIGIALNHIYSSPVGLLDNTAIIPMRLTVHGGLVLERYDKMLDGTYEFSVRYDRQPALSLQGVNSALLVNANYYFNSYFSLGMGARPNLTNDSWKSINTFIISTGIIPPKSDFLKVNLSYGVSMGQIGFANTFEIGLILFSPKHCISNNPCPDMNGKERKMNLIF